jgi:hypothetical protein
MTDPNVWGPPLWDLLFTLAFQVPSDQISGVIDLFAQLEKVLPCQTCRRSYALFRKQVRPLINLRCDNAKAAEWLWTIHDMVNQKLGKTAISYDKLERKHQLITTLAHPFSALDLVCIMSCTVKMQHASDFCVTLIRVATVCPGLKHFAEAFSSLPLDKNNIRDSLYQARNVLCTMYGMSAIGRDAFDARYPIVFAEGKTRA